MSNEGTTNVDANDDEWITSDEDEIFPPTRPKRIDSSLENVARERFGNISAMALLQKLFPHSDFNKGMNLSQMEILHALLGQPMPHRKKLHQYNTIEDAVELIKTSKKILVLSGAGVSTSAGIPDFRSEDGIYARLRTDFPDLPTPQSMFEIDYFRQDPRPFFKFAKEIYPGQFQPTIGHRFVKCIEQHGQLLRNYTQNIDTLEQVAGIERVINCHGSFATATCTLCRTRVDSELIKGDILQGIIPKCTKCPADCDQMAVFKPDIVFFGEGLPDTFHNTFSMDKDHCDLLIVIGSSMKVRPVALIPHNVPDSVPQILINREPLNHMDFDIELLGNCDNIIQELCLRLGDDWASLCPAESSRLQQINELHLEPGRAKIIQNDDIAGPASESLAESVVANETDGSSQYETDDEEDEIIANTSSVATKLPPSSFLFIAPSRYIFTGAEVSEREVNRYRKKNNIVQEGSQSSIYCTR
ncbi:NAD-dependent protein deacetylase sirtuin-1, partial [Fragariocoptes setiger]